MILLVVLLQSVLCHETFVRAALDPLFLSPFLSCKALGHLLLSSFLALPRSLHFWMSFSLRFDHVGPFSALAIYSKLIAVLQIEPSLSKRMDGVK